MKLLGTIRAERYASLVSDAALRETPGSQYAGGHRIRVTPVPIPNTEVKPDTADGTAWETVWESRSLRAVIRTKRPDAMSGQLHRVFLFVRPVVDASASRRTFDLACGVRLQPDRPAYSG